ncbi:MAG: amidohydrolase [Synergistaceae bacterium]|jgi:predicted amidohydrolase YtcJ|nr:amidohydrolase [Synergistaceae bacterium]
MDLILRNGKISTMDRKKPEVSAVAVDGGLVAARGTSEEIMALKTRDTDVVDLGGARVVPGFNDSHLHILNYAVLNEECDLRGFRSVGEIVSRMKRHIGEKRIPKGNWVIGTQWNQELFAEKKFPTRDDLDAVSREHPAVCIRACFHVVCVNTRTLEMMGLCGGGARSAAAPIRFRGAWAIGEKEVRTGIFAESAADAVFDAIAQTSPDEIAKYLAKVGLELTRHGITSLQSDDFPDAVNYEDVIAAYVGLARDGRLLFRVCQQRRPPDGCDLDDFLSEPHDLSGADGFYKLGPVKFVADGSLGARTAFLSRPYRDDPSTRGVAIHSQDELDYLVRRTHEAGQSAAIHCIGDAAAYMAMESIRKASEPKKFDARHGLVHCQITDAPLLKMFRELRVLAYVQPIFLDSDLHIVESRVGGSLAATSYNFKTMADTGVAMSLGTDCPAAPVNPMHNIYSAVTRKDLAGNPAGGFLPEQRMTVWEAVRAYTAVSAYCSREEDVKGTIERGRMADMAVLSDDIFEMDPDGIKDAGVDMTILGGRIVWRR